MWWKDAEETGDTSAGGGSAATSSPSLPTVIVTAERPAIAQEGDSVTVLVRVQAPAVPSEPSGTAAGRKPMHLALVVDRSGSMDGEPLREALRCVEYIVTHLRPEDKAGVVVYDDKVQTLVPLSPARDRTRFLPALRGVRSGGSTALHAGWMQGAELLAPHTDAASLSRVLLLSDGQANAGLTDVDEIASQCRALAGAGVSTTTVGLGRGFNEDLMIAMARSGEGQTYYGQTAEDLHDSFQSELSLLQSLYARHLTARLVPGPGVIVEALSVAAVAADAPVPLSDLSYDAEVFLLLRLTVAPRPTGEPDAALLSVTVQGHFVEGGSGGRFETPPTLLQLPVLPRAAVERLPLDALVVQRSIEIQTANYFDEVRSALRRGDRRAAAVVLESARALAADHEWARDSVTALTALMEQDEEMAKKELQYKSRKFRARQASPYEAEPSAAPASAPIPAFLRRKSEEGKK